MHTLTTSEKSSRAPSLSREMLRIRARFLCSRRSIRPMQQNVSQCRQRPDAIQLTFEYDGEHNRDGANSTQGNRSWKDSVLYSSSDSRNVMALTTGGGQSSSKRGRGGLCRDLQGQSINVNGKANNVIKISIHEVELATCP